MINVLPRSIFLKKKKKITFSKTWFIFFFSNRKRVEEFIDLGTEDTTTSTSMPLKKTNQIDTFLNEEKVGNFFHIYIF